MDWGCEVAQVFLQRKKESQGNPDFLLVKVPKTGLEPVWAQCPRDFKSLVSTIPPLRQLFFLVSGCKGKEILAFTLYCLGYIFSCFNIFCL